MRVHYCHGLESGPQGYKVRQLEEQGFAVTALDMEMHVWHPHKRNSVLRSLLVQPARRWPTEWLAGALQDSFQACVEVHRHALATAAVQPDVLVGSSWGGAVAAALLADGAWRGPAVLLCPALRKKERWGWGPLEGDAHAADSVLRGLAAAPEDSRRRWLIVHGDADQTVPLEDSQEMARLAGIPLEVVEGGSHGLSAPTADGRLAAWIRAAVEGNALPRPQ
mmetsp:Transcript_105740/g.309297  ORF Transcript_105740/g.309297 Transcript_105740/m.309297 type:complete len:222 (-) Transcript_105740:62-727(-)